MHFTFKFSVDYVNGKSSNLTGFFLYVNISTKGGETNQKETKKKSRLAETGKKLVAG